MSATPAMKWPQVAAVRIATQHWHGFRGGNPMELLLLVLLLLLMLSEKVETPVCVFFSCMGAKPGKPNRKCVVGRPPYCVLFTHEYYSRSYMPSRTRTLGIRSVWCSRLLGAGRGSLRFVSRSRMGGGCDGNIGMDASCRACPSLPAGGRLAPCLQERLSLACRHGLLLPAGRACPLSAGMICWQSFANTCAFVRVFGGHPFPFLRLTRFFFGRTKRIADVD